MDAQESQKKLFSNGFAVIIGTGVDVHGNSALKYHSTINDAEWISEILTDESRCAYPKDQVKVLVGNGAKKEDIMSAFVWLAEKSTDESTVLIFFSGHGRRFKDEAETFIVPYGASKDCTQTIISGKELFMAIKAISAKKVILLTNCCWAGGVIPNLSSLGVGDSDEPFGLGNVPLSEEHIKKLSAGRGFAVLSSSRRNEVSYTGFRNYKRGKAYSAFAAGICHGLLGIGLPATDGVVRISDLASFCQEFVRKKTKNHQNPYFDFDRADNFVVAHLYAGLTGRSNLGDDEDTSDGFEVRDDDDEEDNNGGTSQVMQNQTFSNMGIFAHGNSVAFGGINNWARTGNSSVTFHWGPPTN